MDYIDYSHHTVRDWHLILNKLESLRGSVEATFAQFANITGSQVLPWWDSPPVVDNLLEAFNGYQQSYPRVHQALLNSHVPEDTRHLCGGSSRPGTFKKPHACLPSEFVTHDGHPPNPSALALSPAQPSPSVNGLSVAMAVPSAPPKQSKTPMLKIRYRF